ncbi:phosphoribosylformylglycinamidine synthase subunit PurL [SAR202 cluster bacterium AD-804-J14_MRT_500m]|nr:phosphoribosylformylglycinamidine synthase subunit PurL [SAR202 cluster bacterium AD-804-J14_MRT_500m]
MESVTKATLDEIALSEEEYELIVERLGREPNRVELGMFGALWSEHCGYKHSKLLLRLLPSKSPRVLLPPGAENAGAVDIGDGLAVVFKMESHNHPSAIEPFQGAATGVGGIVRDILAMGARPIALLNSLRFGPLDDPRNRYLFNGVVGGISWYGNCIGIPDVGGEISFSQSYAGNPLVNALCVGLVETKNIAHSSLGDEGNVLLLVGSDTGRDGIHGASGLASRTFEAQRELRPAVQVGNPFLEKVLIEACLEALRSGCVVGIQDLGAAGLTSSTVESADRAGGGVIVDVSDVHRRESGMSSYEVMLSESQERMLLATSVGDKERLARVLEKWDLSWSTLGLVTSDKNVRVMDGDIEEANLPVQALTDPKLYRLKGSKSQESRLARNFPLSKIPLVDKSPGDVLLALLESPNIASKSYVFRQYDHQVQTNTVLGPGEADAALLRIKGTAKGIAISTDGNGRYCYLDPFKGGAIAVAESCRNVSCVGALPIALTDCLNFGNPERPEIYYQLEWCIRGIAQACRVLDVPVVSGNVSLYNETEEDPIFPTPIIGAMGLSHDVSKHVASGFSEEGDLVVLLGTDSLSGRINGLAGSEFLQLEHGRVLGRPNINLALEKQVQMLCRILINEEQVDSAHDCSDGGLAVALAECCIGGGMGFVGDFDLRGRWDTALFGETQSRILVSLPEINLSRLKVMAGECSVPYVILGRTGGGRFGLGRLLSLPVDRLVERWGQGLEEALTAIPR